METLLSVYWERGSLLHTVREQNETLDFKENQQLNSVQHIVNSVGLCVYQIEGMKHAYITRGHRLRQTSTKMY